MSPVVSGDRRDNLPSPLTTFTGRDRQLVELAELVSRDRLVTLVGAPGIGKTRLAIKVGSELLDRYPDGVWLVELAPLAEPTLLPQAIADALGVPEAPGRLIIETLTYALSARSALVILDNCEHLIEACALFSDVLLPACPKIHMLATSRESLRIRGETVWSVPPLTVPRHQQSSLRSLMDSESGVLLADRLSSTVPNLPLDESLAPALIRICERLDGLPLALELVAARAQVLPVALIADRLEDRFRLLTSGSRVSLPRHQTLSALVEWSYALLDQSEQTLLRRLAVFAGGWTVEAAEIVCGDPSLDVLDCLSRLADKSLVQLSQTEQPRYRFLETIRQFAADKLRESGEEVAIRKRHVEWLVQLAQWGRIDAEASKQSACLHDLAMERDNVRAGLDWLVTSAPDAEIGVPLADRLWWSFFVDGHHVSALRYLNQVLERTDESSDSRAHALCGVGYLNLSLSNASDARVAAKAAIELARRHGDRGCEMLSMLVLGGTSLNQGDLDGAVAIFNDVQTMSNESGLELVQAMSLWWLGEVARATGQLDRERDLLERSLAVVRAIGTTWGSCYPLDSLGHVSLAEGNAAQALALHKECLEVRLRLNDGRGIWLDLEWIAWAAAVLHRDERAARLFGAADAMRQSLGGTLLQPDEIQRPRYLETTRAALGTAEFEEAWAEGRAWSRDVAIQYALETDSRRDTSAEARAREPLSRRELDVARLIMRGASNREMADALVIAEGTVGTHVARILRKLGFHSRAQVAAWMAGRSGPERL